MRQVVPCAVIASREASSYAEAQLRRLAETLFFRRLAMSDIKVWIDNEVKANDVVLFMKGTPTVPQCGFSSQVVQILDYLGVNYKGVNVLENADVREGVKEYSNWPTIPQLYVKGEFIGGCDI